MSNIIYEQLVTATLKGDTEAREKLENRVESEIRGYLEDYVDKHGGDIEVIESEISLSVKERIFSKLDKFLFTTPFSRWVRVATRNEVVDYNRRRMRLSA
jgi:hypothetical protein